jgi:peptidoglycan/LPS O-acetylase OafA/YrhL/CubicO group peptidase (beta-lactamase class C family)
MGEAIFKINYEPRAHFKTLDGLRGLAILLVLLIHFFKFIPGWLGVDLFFVLSGFLITGILIDSKNTANYYPNFIIRRVLRIFPLYFLFLFLFFIGIPLIAGKTFINHNQYYFDNQWWFWTYLQNWLFVVNEGYENNRILAHFWSLAIEEQFYLVWPLFVWLLSSKQLLKFSIFITILSIITRIAYFVYGYSWLATDTTITRLDTLCLGAVIAILIREHNPRLWLEKYSRLIFKISFLVVLLLLVLDHSWFRPEGTIMRTIGLTIVAIMFASLLIISLSDNPKSFATRFFSSKILGFFGKYSYSMYVFHFPLLFFFVPQTRNLINRLEGSGITSFFIAGILGIMLTVLISLLTWRIIEKPILGLKKYFAPKKDVMIIEPAYLRKRGFLISSLTVILLFFIGLSFLYTHKPKPVKCNSPLVTENLTCIANKQMQKYKAHGLGYCIILPGDSVISGSVGIVRNNVPIQDSMQWMFGSCTKTFIAVVALQLQEEGRWSLDDKVGKYFTHASIDSNNTIRQLLNHTSSISDGESEKYFKALFLKIDSIWQPLDILNYNNTRPDKTKEGVFHYSNTNYLILSILIEKVTGNSLSTELQNRIFKKYGLKQTIFVTSNYDVRKMAGAWYDLDKDGLADDVLQKYSKQTPYPLNSTLSLYYGFGNIVSTTRDMARWTRLLYTGKVLKKGSMKEMLTWANGSDRDENFKGYGLGTDFLMLSGLKNYGHTGLGIHASGMFYTPELDLTMVLVTNEQSLVERDAKIEMYDYLIEYLEKREVLCK